MKWWQHLTGAGIAFPMVYVTIPYRTEAPIDSFTRTYSKLHVQPGEIVHISSTVKRTDTCSSTAHRLWIDESGNVFEDEMFDLPSVPTGVEQFERDVKIPVSAKSGFLRMRVKTVFYCNWLQRLFSTGPTLVLPDVIFEVSRKDPE